MALVQSFEPVIGKNPRVLILGSMPGIASLDAVQYYAHPRNLFWKIMQVLFAINAEAAYPERIRQIQTKPVVLWDSLKRCDREGSLDSSIVGQSVEANDIDGLLYQYPSIKLIVFNGATSEKYFRKLVLPKIDCSTEVQLLKMPSTSPANASISYERKLENWKQILNYL